MSYIKTVGVLGTEYTVIESTKEQDPKLEGCDGYCDDTIHQCVIDNCSEKDIMSKNNLNEYKSKVMRHEIIHAFLFESGLANNSGWATNEEMVDWFAIQFPKILKAFQETNCM